MSARNKTESLKQEEGIGRLNYISYLGLQLSSI